MKINVVYNKEIKGYEKILEEVQNALASNKAEFESFDIREMKQFGSFTLVIGGDGTLLRACSFYAQYNIPVLGINFGRLGFLSQARVSNINEVISSVLKGEYSIEERLMLASENSVALNDFVIKGCISSRTSKFYLEINGKFVCDYIADGLIISTPTGSTAYSLSAGGSIVDPTIHSILLTPICPHSLFDRSIIFAPDKKLTVSTREINNPAEANLAIDGVVVDGLYQHDSIVIERGERSAKLIQLKNTDFYDILTQKMMMRGN